MADFLQDSFTGANGTLISARAPELGGTWAQHPNFTANTILIQGNKATGSNAAGTSIYYNNAAPGSADYTQTATIQINSAGAVSPGVIVRLQTGSSTLYQFFHDSTGWVIGKILNGVSSNVAYLAGNAPAVNTDTLIALSVVGNTLTAYVNGSQILTGTDTDITAAGFAGIRSRATGTIDTIVGANFSGVLLSGANGVSTPTGSTGFIGPDPKLIADGIWCWFTEPRAVHYNGATYIGTVSKTGDVQVHKYVHSSKTLTSFTLATALETDDHDHPAIHIRSDGRIACFYSKHSNGNGPYYKISTNPEDISAWGPQVQFNTPNNSYSNPVVLSQQPGKLWLFSREWAADTTRRWGFRTTTDAEYTNWTAFQYLWAPAAAPNQPYLKFADDGQKRVHFVGTSQHPANGQVSIYHFYMELDGSNVPHYYKSDGTEIVAALPFNTTHATLVYDGSAVKAWSWEIKLDPTGKPRILGVIYPNNNGTVMTLVQWRWTGTQWLQTNITDGGTSLYAAEQYYAGGLCFDANNVNIVYLSAPISGVREVQKWVSADSGATFAKEANITFGTSASVINARPYSPINHPPEMPVLFWSGRYTTFTNYDTSIQFVPSSEVYLAGANGQATPSAGTGALSQQHLLAGANGTATPSASTGALVQQHVLAGANGATTPAGSTGALGGEPVGAPGYYSATGFEPSAFVVLHELPGANAAATPTASSGALITSSDLTGANGAATPTASTGSLVQQHVLAGANGASTPSASTGALDAQGDLAGANGATTPTGSTGALIQQHLLAGANGTATPSAPTGVLIIQVDNGIDGLAAGWLVGDLEAIYADLAINQLNATFNGITTHVLFDQPDAEVFGGAAQVRDYRIRFQTGKWPAIKRGSVVTIAGKTYTVREVRRLNDGLETEATLAA